MKKLLLGLFLVSSALAFSARVIKSTEAVVKNNVIYVGQEKSPYTGVIETYNEKGVLEAKADIKNGQMDGSSKIYYPSGKLQSEATFKNNVQVGVQKDYTEDGKLKLELPYKNGKLDGVAKAYDENGKVVQQATFKNGKQVK